MDIKLVNTKQEIARAYEKAIAAINVKAGVVFDPKKEAKSKKNAEVLEKSNTVKAAQTVEQIAKLQDKMGAAFTELVTVLNAKIEECNTIDETIIIKKEALKNMYDIELAAETLAGLINAQSEAKAIFEVEVNSIKEALEEEVASLTAELAEVRANHEASIKALDEKTADERKKAEDQWKYDFNRKKKLADDEFEDEKKARERVVADKEYAVEVREDAVTVREAKMTALEAEVASIPEKVAAAKTEGEAEGKKKAETSFAFEKRAMEANHKSAVAILENTTQMHEKTIDRQAIEISDLKKKLDDAYAQIKDVASKTVEATANANTIKALEKAAESNRNFK